jgi:hypothetical protein
MLMQPLPMTLRTVRGKANVFVESEDDHGRKVEPLFAMKPDQFSESSYGC